MTKSDRHARATAIMAGRTLGELSKEERREVMGLCLETIKEELESPEAQAILSQEVLK